MNTCEAAVSFLEDFWSIAMGCSLYTGIGIIKLLIFTAFNSKTFTIIINMSTVCAKLAGKVDPVWNG